MTRLGLARIVAACWLLLVAPALWAGGFQVSPVLARIQPGQQVANFTLGNNGTEPVTVQVDVLDWRQEPHGEHFEPATGVLVAPRVVALQPGESRLVRVALREPAAVERALRVEFRELPPPPDPGFVGVRTAVTQSVPLIFLAEGEPQVSWQATLDDDGQLLLSASNHGGRYFRADALEVVDARGALLAEHAGAVHLLAGSSARWPLVTHADLEAGDAVRLRFPAGSDPDGIALVVE